MKKKIYSVNKVVSDLYLSPYKYADLVISGRIYVEIGKFLWFEFEPEFSYTLNIPFIDNPYLDGHYDTNRILKVYGKMVEQELLDKIQEFKEKYYESKSNKSTV